MRSRDGNSYSSFAICSIAFFLPLALNASEYLISYRYIVKDAVLYNEELLISSAMQPCKKTNKQSFQALEIPLSHHKSLKQSIEENAEEFIDYLHLLGLDLEYKSESNNYQHSSTSIHTLKTQCFKVDFNDNLARITPLK